MKYIKLNFMSLLIFSLFAFCAHAATYYVDQSHPSASDLNPGTETLPWKTPNKAAQTIKAGDTVLIKSGEYNVGVGTWYSPALNPANSGTAQNPIIFKAYPGHRVKLVATIKVVGSYQRNYIIWDGFILESTSYNTAAEGGVAIQEAIGIVIQNCEIIGHTIDINDNHQGIWIQDSNNITIKNNKIRGVKGGNGSFAIKSYNSNDVLIENNEIYDCLGGIQPKHNHENWIIRYNLIRDCTYGYDGAAATDYSYNRNIKIYQNIFSNISGDAIVPHVNFQNSKIYNNIFYNIAGFGIGWMLGTSSLEAFNNIFFKLSGIMDVCGEWYQNYTITYWNYNAYYVTPRFDGSRTFSQWQSQTGRDLNSFVSNPLFVNPPSNFFLQASSPALNAGIDRQDYNNNGNTTERINMGAYITGKECIGLLSNCNIDKTPPDPPKNLRIEQ